MTQVEQPRAVSILGSTGSIGAQALDVARLHPERIRVVALAAGRRVERLIEQALEFRPEMVGVEDPDAVPAVESALGPSVAVFASEDGLRRAAAWTGASIVLNALVGARGLLPSLVALEAGRTLALANKETLVAGGPLVAEAALRGGGRVVAVDSEHWALGELMEGRDAAEALQVWITASGGPLRKIDRSLWKALQPAEVLEHPIWSMGPRITIDSATLMNKGFEVLEARWLFDLPLDRVGAVIQPEALVHAMVEWGDGSWTAQLSSPSMGLPIQKALLGVRTQPTPSRALGLLEAGALHFEPIDEERFPCFALARAAGHAGGSYPAALNAADEIAVEAFLKGAIGFLDIAGVLGKVMDRHARRELSSAEDVWEADREARAVARSLI